MCVQVCTGTYVNSVSIEYEKKTLWEFLLSVGITSTHALKLAC